MGDNQGVYLTAQNFILDLRNRLNSKLIITKHSGLYWNGHLGEEQGKLIKLRKTAVMKKIPKKILFAFPMKIIRKSIEHEIFNKNFPFH